MLLSNTGASLAGCDESGESPEARSGRALPVPDQTARGKFPSGRKGMCYRQAEWTQGNNRAIPFQLLEEVCGADLSTEILGRSHLHTNDSGLEARRSK
jgi:hypothetical protein